MAKQRVSKELRELQWQGIASEAFEALKGQWRSTKAGTGAMPHTYGDPGRRPA